MSKPACHYESEHGWLSAEHLRDCDDTECRGCKPCPESHCALRGRCANHVKHGAGIYTCPSCIGGVRRSIVKIVEHHAGSMRWEAIEAGVDSEAFNLIGPAASVDQVIGKRTLVDSSRGWCEFPRPDDPHHPYAVLGRWDLELREVYGPQTDLFITVTSAANFLIGLLAGPFPHTREFEDFAVDLGVCLRHLEQVAHDSRQPEQGRRCPKCCDERGKGPRLRKHYGKGDGEATKAGDHDTWICPDEPAHWWSERDYRERVATDFVKHADELTMADLPERTGIPRGTLSRWASRTYLGLDADGEPIYREPKLRSRGRDASGRKTYRVKDVLILQGVSLDNKTLDVSKSG